MGNIEVLNPCLSIFKWSFINIGELCATSFGIRVGRWLGEEEEEEKEEELSHQCKD